MCTILLLFQHNPAHPVIVAANRDEMYTRATEGPTVLREDPRAVGGRDKVHGGSWMGFTNAGLFVGLTNNPSFDKRKKSRGHIVASLLAATNADSAVTCLYELIDQYDYRDFNVVVGDEHRMHYLRYDAGSTDGYDLDPGVHVIPSAAAANDRSFFKVDRAHRLIDELDTHGSLETVQSGLIGVLADRELPESLPPSTPVGPWGPEIMRRLHGICVETPLYGTRSATWGALQPTSQWQYAYCEGPPRREAFEDYSGLLQG